MPVDPLLDAAVIGVATWTLAYDAAILSNRSMLVALAVWAVLAVPGVWLLVLLRRQRRATTEAPGDDHTARRAWWRVVAVAAVCVLGLIAAVSLARQGSGTSWTRAWLPGMAACAIGSVVAVAEWRSRRGALPTVAAGRACGRAGVELGAVLAMAAGLAALSLFVNRPDADDVFYVNHAQWVVDHGTFAVRDTLFSDERFPSQEHPPLASYEALAGTAGRLVNRPAADIEYYLVTPLATFLAVLALWKLLRTWGALLPAVAVAVGAVFLLMGGADHASFGNLFLGRMWQGKVIYLSVMIPLLFAQLTEWSRRPSRAGVALLLLLGVASIGLTPTAALTVTLVAVAALAPLALRRPWLALLGVAAVSLYPVIGAVLSRLDRGGGSADARAIALSDPAATFAKVFGYGAIAGIAAVALVTGWLALRRRDARLTAAVASSIALLLLAPGVLDRLGRFTGSVAVLWRLLWVVPAAALVGALGTVAAAVRGWRWLGLLSAAAMSAALVWAGTPIWASSNHATLTARPQWKLDPAALAAARAIAAHADPGSVVLAPTTVSQALAVLTTRVHPVDPRDDYVDYTSDPAFHIADRLALQAFVNSGGAAGADRATVAAALRDVGVRVACIPGDATGAAQTLTAVGYAPSLSADGLRCYAVR
jgi:Family of unknown function (DUF6077)